MYNNEFKVIDTPEKAYFLGQAFGDGCNQYGDHNIKLVYKFSMASEIQDKPLYEKIQKMFPFLHLHERHTSSDIVELSCGYKQLSLDLKELGLTQNKCIQDKSGNFNLPKLPEELMSHFIRGFFDADGSVYYPTRYRSRNNTRVSIGLGAQNFCKQLFEYIKSRGINATYREREKLARSNDDKWFKGYEIDITSREECLKFADFIYKDSTIHLERKYNLFYTYVESNLQKRRKLYNPCPYCGSEHVVSKGKRQTNSGLKLRLYCKDCNKNYQMDMPLVEVIQHEKDS